MKRTGQCMCGAVTFTAETAQGFSMCHCKMCQRWSAGGFMGVPTTAFDVTSGKDDLVDYVSSPWASRGFCGICGSNVYFKLKQGDSESVAFGALDDTTGLVMKNHWFADLQTEEFAKRDETKSYTQAQIEEMFGGNG